MSIGSIRDLGTINNADAELILMKLPNPEPMSIEDIHNLTEDQAMSVLRSARRELVSQLLYQEYHEHLFDDCGDYLDAASDNWHRLWSACFNSDGTELVSSVKAFLLEHPSEWLATDGEIRYSILPEDYVEASYD
jgi:hypothetical protein